MVESLQEDSIGEQSRIAVAKIRAHVDTLKQAVREHKFEDKCICGVLKGIPHFCTGDATKNGKGHYSNDPLQDH